jgi:hypothetical protein
LYVQGDVGYPAKQGGGQENNKQKKWQQREKNT